MKQIMYSKHLRYHHWTNKKNYSYQKNKSNNRRKVNRLNSNLLFNNLCFRRLKVQLLNYQQIKHKSRLFHAISHLFFQILKRRETTNLTIQSGLNRKCLKLQKTINKNRLQPLRLLYNQYKHKRNHPCW